ncbi:hypothetical protein J1770_gp62 [Gordonia phage EMoore]|uniref:Uncharacterized protein n=1 Tax=Gordonia phage EMoore TaxID=2656534 RepID=A0A649VTI8_9CAUD|nr:hypothetical protein J1770_gp62 [Gordonia phage EMoore]QGJ95847.1 hypothetical protein SEA_EMOORE_62 [Gordonia phage EMoore]
MHIEPSHVQSLVDDVISRFARDSRRHPNVDEIPESTAPALHDLAAEVYAMGYTDGTIVTSNREYQAARRNRERAERDAEQADKTIEDAIRDLGEQGRTV